MTTMATMVASTTRTMATTRRCAGIAAVSGPCDRSALRRVASSQRIRQQVLRRELSGNQKVPSTMPCQAVTLPWAVIDGNTLTRHTAYSVVP